MRSYLSSAPSRNLKASSQKPRDGVCIEEIGTFMPIAQEKDQVSIDLERAKYWISVGAQPTDIVKKLMNRQAAKKAE